MQPVVMAMAMQECSSGKKRKVEDDDNDDDVVKRKVKKEDDGEEEEAEGKCPHCTFSCTSAEALSQHLRLHFPEENLKPRELYCKECDIQFSSVTTYRGHKLYYCQQRRRVTTPGRRESSSPRRPSSAKPMASPPSAVLPFPATNGHLTPPLAAHPAALHMLHAPFALPYIHITPEQPPTPKSSPPPPPPAPPSEDEPLDLSTKSSSSSSPTVKREPTTPPPRRPRTPGAATSPLRPDLYPMSLLPLVQPQHEALLLL
jgi:hypothetical protein